MKSDESYSTKEYNDFSEIKINKYEQYGCVEIKKTKENYLTDEENNSSNSDNTIEITKKNTINDELIKNASHPIRTIVTAATTTVTAAAVVTTTFLSPIPNISDVLFNAGNDYVQYSLKMDELDLETNYKIEVKNPNFYFIEDLDTSNIESLEYITNYVYGLKPNYKYEFNLLRENGDIGGYSSFYSKSFYTLEAESPNANFHFDLNGDLLEYKIVLSDYYKICSDTYFTYKINGEEIENIPFDSEYTNTISYCEYPITFNVYSTLYDEVKLIGETTYYFTSISDEVTNNSIKLIGTIGTSYQNAKEYNIKVKTFDEVGNCVEEQNSSLSSFDVNTEFLFANSFYSYQYQITLGNKQVFDSNLKYSKKIIHFDEYEIIKDGIKIHSNSFSPADDIYTKDAKSNKIKVDAYDGYCIIPLYDEENTRINYLSYDLTINNFIYEFVPDKNQIIVDDFDLYNINGNMYIKTHGFTSLYLDQLTVDVNGAKIKIDNDSGTYLLPNINEETVELSCYIEVNSEVLSTRINMTLNKTDIRTNYNVNEGLFTFESTNSLGLPIKVCFYNENKEQIDVLQSSAYVDNTLALNKEVRNDVRYIAYEIGDEDEVIFSSEYLERINTNCLDSSLITQSIDNRGLVLTVNGINESYTAYYINDYEEKVNLTILENRIIIPASDTHYNNYSITLVTSLETGQLVIEPKTLIFIDKVELHNNMSNCLQFNCLSFGTPTDYVLVVEAYENDILIKSEPLPWESLYVNMAALYDINEDLSNDTTFKLFLKDSNDNVVSDTFTYTIEKELKTTEAYDRTTVNPGEIFVTYNEDSTINMYIPIGFVCDDPDTLFIVELSNETYGFYQEIEVKDRVLVLENYQNINYVIRYKVLKKNNQMSFVFDDITPSGSINEPSWLSLNIESIDNYDGTKTLKLDFSDLSYYDFDLSKIRFINNSYTYDETTQIVTLIVDNDIEKLSMIYGYNYLEDENYKKVIEVDSTVVVEGSAYHVYCIYL